MSQADQPVITSSRKVRQYEVKLGTTSIIFANQVQFKAIVRDGSKLFLIVEETFGNADEQHEVHIVGYGSEAYIHPKAKYIESLQIGSGIVHFYAQHALANSEDPAAAGKRVGGHTK
jgi:hypothetical protein